MATQVARIQVRRGDAADWTTENPVLGDGEIGYERNTRRQKYGDGTTPWNALPYAGSPLAAMSQTEAEAGVATTVRGITAAVFKAAVTTLARLAMSHANLHVQPVWTGVGAHPVRTIAQFERWRQPTAPIVGANYAHDGDEWEVTE